MASAVPGAPGQQVCSVLAAVHPEAAAQTAGPGLETSGPAGPAEAWRSRTTGVFVFFKGF